ncbi:MAG TPA: ferritin family protein [Anaerolineae bacterium]|nr:ferritin family protein [Anaerolineae bacterium]HNT05599.1 ferritin family protein [Anaerolineae bacterium]HOU23729.1 ferritin family protein [Anaerolineae bacterium]HQJ50491.1 ferritin family protein [Anaerolineae bacterium]
MAVQAEESAFRFYSAAVDKVKDPEAKNVFASLAKEEERHRKIVQDEYNRLTQDPTWDRYSIWRDVI